MKPDQFNQQGFDWQWSMTWRYATLLVVQTRTSQCASLYYLSNFFVEIITDAPQLEILRIRALTLTDELEFYTRDIPLEELTTP